MEPTTTQPISLSRAYSRAERAADAVLHVLGVTGALLAAPVIITLAVVWHGDMPTVAAASIYGASMIAMFTFSATYNMIEHPGLKPLLRRFDHSAIYIKIAGTYTPFAVLLGGVNALPLLIGIWFAALVGIGLRVLAAGRFEWLALGLYLAMGWAIVLFGQPILAELTPASLMLTILGGVLYTIGVVFHLWEKLPFQNAIWHALVLVATFIFYAAIIVEVAVTAPAL